MRPRLIIDCDTGRDDALAIWLALSLKAPLWAVVASYGNTVLDNVTENCLRVLAYAGRSDIPVVRGAPAPARHHKGVDDVVAPRQASTGNGLCNLTLPPSEESPRSIAPEDMLAGAPIDYIVTGPATNLAALLAAQGDTARSAIARVTLWGGKLDGLWATLPGADFNTICDPRATQAVIESGLPVRFVPMDTTWPIMLTLPEIEALRPRTDIAAFARALMIAHVKNFAPEPVFRFHDPAVIIALDDDAHYRNARVRIVTDEADPQFGRMIEAADGHPVRLYVPDEARRAAILEEILAGLGFER